MSVEVTKRIETTYNLIKKRYFTKLRLRKTFFLRRLCPAQYKIDSSSGVH